MVIFCCANEFKMRSTGRGRIIGGKEGQERKGDGKGWDGGWE